MGSSLKNYQDFSPQFEWRDHPDYRVLIVYLQGFRSSQLKVQVTSTGKLRVSGERGIDGGKWLRFHKELDVPTDVDTDKISAKLEDGTLYVKQPKKLSAATSTNLPEKPTSMPKPKPESRPPPAAGKPMGIESEFRPPPAAGKPMGTESEFRPPPTAGKPMGIESEFRPPPAAGKPMGIESEFRPPPAAGKPKADPQPLAEPPKPAAAKSTIDLPNFRQNTPKSQNEKRQSQSNRKQAHTSPKPQELTKACEDHLDLPDRSPTVPQNVPQSQNEEPQEQAHGKQIPPPQKLQEKTEEEKAKAHTNLKEALEKTRDEERGKEGIGSKMVEEKGKEGIGSKIGEGKGKEEKGSHGREEKEGEVAEERRRRRKRSEEMVEKSGSWRRREGYKQVIDGVVKDLRTNMVTLVLGIAVLVILYLKVTKKCHVDEEL